MKYFFILTFYLLILSCEKINPDTKAYLDKKTTNFDSQNKLFKDINNQIKKSKIIFLGEQNHGDANTLTIKSEFIESFVNYSNDSVLLIFESDYVGNYFFANSSNYKDFIYPVWTKCKLGNTMKIIDSLVKKNKIEIMGIDPVLFPLTLKKIQENKTFDSNVIDLINKKKPCKDFEAIKNPDLYKIKQPQIRNSLAAFNEMKCTSKRGNIRDKQMAINLYDIYLKNKNKKIIVWAANTHISKNFIEFVYTKNYKKIQSMNREISMVQHFKKLTDIKTTSIGFTSKKGEFGRVGSAKKQIKVTKKDLEYYLKGKFNLINLNEADNVIFNSQIYNHLSLSADWGKMFDFVVNIEENEPCV